jgi:hypothetical protein
MRGNSHWQLAQFVAGLPGMPALGGLGALVAGAAAQLNRDLVIDVGHFLGTVPPTRCVGLLGGEMTQVDLLTCEPYLNSTGLAMIVGGVAIGTVAWLLFRTSQRSPS